MEIVSDHVHRVLAYVEALNRHGVRPRRVVVDEFAKDPDQHIRTTSGLARATGMDVWLRSMWMFQSQTVEDETFCQYMARLMWIRDEPDVELTTIGRALLKALNAPAIEETATDVFEVVLDPKNPFAYAQALGGLSMLKDALLVEPYFRLEQLMDVAEFDNITRVLLGSRLKPREYEVLATGLASLPEGRRLEVRKAQDLHDRYLIPADDGSVLMLGSSLGGIGKKVSTMTTLGEVASQALRAAHEEIWKLAEVIEPRQPPRPTTEVDSQTSAKTGDSTAKKAPVTKGARKATAKKPSGRAKPNE